MAVNMTKHHYTLSLVSIMIQESRNYCNTSNTIAIVIPLVTWYSASIIDKDSLDNDRLSHRFQNHENT